MCHLQRRQKTLLMIDNSIIVHIFMWVPCYRCLTTHLQQDNKYQSRQKFVMEYNFRNFLIIMLDHYTSIPQNTLGQPNIVNEIFLKIFLHLLLYTSHKYSLTHTPQILIMHIAWPFIKILLVSHQTHHCPVFWKHLWSYQNSKYSKNLQQEILGEEETTN